MLGLLRHLTPAPSPQAPRNSEPIRLERNRHHDLLPRLIRNLRVRPPVWTRRPVRMLRCGQVTHRLLPRLHGPETKYMSSRNRPRPLGMLVLERLRGRASMRGLVTTEVVRPRVVPQALTIRTYASESPAAATRLMSVVPLRCSAIRMSAVTQIAQIPVIGKQARPPSAPKSNRPPHTSRMTNFTPPNSVKVRGRTRHDNRLTNRLSPGNTGPQIARTRAIPPTLLGMKPRIQLITSKVHGRTTIPSTRNLAEPITTGRMT